jgi:hypothetical protein
LNYGLKTLKHDTVKEENQGEKENQFAEENQATTD